MKRLDEEVVGEEKQLGRGSSSQLREPWLDRVVVLNGRGDVESLDQINVLNVYELHTVELQSD